MMFMNQDQSPELTLDESVKQVMQTLPPVIRNYLSQGKYSVVAKNLMTKYNLHVDQGGILEREIMLLLMGVDTPDEFTQSLAEEANLNQQTVSSIVQEVNTQIFIPLQEEMRNMARNAVKPMRPAMPMPSETTFRSPTPANPQLPQRPPLSSAPSYSGARQVNASVPRYMPPTPPTPPAPQHFHLENKIPPTPPTPSASPSGLASALKQVLHEGGQTPSNPSEKLLEDHEEPHLNIGVSNNVPPSPRPAVAPSVVGSGIIPPGARFSPIAPRVEPSPVIPKVEPLPVIPEVEPPAPISSSSLPLTPSPTPSFIPPIAKSYVDDPYREPIDEK